MHTIPLFHFPTVPSKSTKVNASDSRAGETPEVRRIIHRGTNTEGILDTETHRR